MRANPPRAPAALARLPGIRAVAYRLCGYVLHGTGAASCEFPVDMAYYRKRG